MSSPAKAHEPTMEEILASIRRIIADEDPPAAGAGPGTVVGRDDGGDVAGGIAEAAQVGEGWVADRHVEDSDDILELTDPVAAEASPAGGHEAALAADEPEPEPAPEPRPAPRPQLRPQPRPAASWPGEDRLLSSTADSVVSSAFGALAHTIVAENSRTLEDLVHEMLRPMLKSWLDDNLPALVERLVRQEIEHVSRGRR